MVRLQRTGRKNEAQFRLVLTEKQNAAKSGKFQEILGYYNPKLSVFKAEGERIKYWVSQGAQVSPTAHNFLVSQNIIEGKKINVLPKKFKTKARKDMKKSA